MSYRRKHSVWRNYLYLAGALIIGVSLVYTHYLTDKIAQSERKKVELFAETIKVIVANNDTEEDIQYPQRVLDLINDVPVILVDEMGKISMYKNFSENADLYHELDKIKADGYPPLKGFGYASQIYFKHTHLLTLLTYFPLVQLLLILVFITIGFFSLSNARKAEQNKVWVGMAKETAHQLGTPISGIIAWIEHLKDMAQDKPEQIEILDELSNDVAKLELIADRFSKIGSAPTLDESNVNEALQEVKDYIQRRASNKISFHFPPANMVFMAKINKPLFSWVIENLLRNSLDAMDEGVGQITAELSEDQHYTHINISDTGKGIPVKDQKTIFEPGFTTKTRGWGLGLSLAKRIIVDYHSGKLFVKRSVINEGTTFTISLPK